MTNLRKLANGQECQIRIPGACNFNSETTILAHTPIKGTHGMGMKCPDLIGAWCCSNCHDIIDGRKKTEFSREEIANFKFEGVIRTQVALIEKGVIKW